MALNGPVVMVTQLVVVTGLANVYPASGEIVVLRRLDGGRLVTVGRIGAQAMN